MYNIVPLIIILLCLAVILFIISKKLPLLATFDISSIPKEKEAETRQKIMEKRLERKAKVIYNKISPILKTIGNFFTRKLKDLQGKIKELEEKYKKRTKKEILMTKEDFDNLEKKLESLLTEAEELLKRDDLETAEKKYIEIIGLDPKNISAYRGLGNLYILQKNYDEARQTFEHVLKLNKLDDLAYAGLGRIAEEKGDLQTAKDDFIKSIGIKNAAIHYFELAEVCLKMGDLHEAAAHLEGALNLEPNNPKYLDLMLTVGIARKDAELSKKVLARLKEVNPENNKITEFEEKIANL
jgi:tetratricopeptide (TPR) repeat protein